MGETILRRSGGPRPALHPTARIFLWAREGVERLAAFLGKPAKVRGTEAGRG